VGRIKGITAVNRADAKLAEQAIELAKARIDAMREMERQRLKRTPVRVLVQQMWARQFFHWHAGQHYVETIDHGKQSFRLTVKNPPRADGNGRRADSLNHPRTPNSIWGRVEGIWAQYV
jgi:hypothetical protein